MHEVELVRSVMTPSVVEDVSYALQDAGIPLENQDSRSMKRVFELVVAATLRQLKIDVTPEGELSHLACEIVANGGPYQRADTCVHIAKKEWEDYLAGVRTPKEADDTDARALGRRASGKASAKVSKKARTK